MADARLVVGVVGAPERSKLPIEVGALVGELGRAQPIDRIGARLGPDFRELVADLVDRDVPGNARPLAVHQLHRIAQTAITMHRLARRCALGAMRSAVDRRIPTRFLADPDAVRHFGGNGAADRTVSADVLADGGAGDIGAGRFRLAHADERERADGCEASRNQTGLTQEAAAIETAARLIADRRYETAATCLAFCSLDQHGSASLSSENG